MEAQQLVDILYCRNKQKSSSEQKVKLKPSVHSSNPLKEEKNFLRLCWIVNSIAPSFVRKIFDDEFHPDKLQATLRNEHQKINDMILKRTIKKSQQRLLNSADVSSQKLDITMMICLLRHIANFPIADGLPFESDKSVAADLSRLKYYRNLIVHRANGTISDEEFKVYFDNVCQSLARIDKTRSHELDKYKTCKLDGISKNAEDNVHINMKIQKWMAREDTLLETNAMVQVEEMIVKNKLVIIKGPPKSRKSETLQHVAIQLRNENQFQIIPVDTQSQIKEFHNPDIKQVFILDDLFGRSRINSSTVRKWRTSSKDTSELLNENTKILIAGNSQIIDQIMDMGIFGDIGVNVFDLEREATCSLVYEQRKKTADYYLGQDDYDKDVLSTHTEYFPLLCHMFATEKTGNIKHFFENNIYDLILSDKLTCAVLCLFVLSNNKVSEGHTESDILQKVCKEIDSKTILTWKETQTQLDHMCISFVTKTAHIYKINDQKIINLLFAYFGQDTFFKFILRNSCSKTIRFRFRLKSLCKRFKEGFIVVKPVNELLYFKRLLTDIVNGNTIDVFKNTQHSSSYFRGKLISTIKNSNNVRATEIKKAILSFSQSDESPLLFASHKGFLDLVDFFIDIKMNINVENLEFKNPVYLAAAGGFLDIVKLLLKNNCDCNSNEKNLPLHIAIKKNHITIVKELLCNKYVKANPNGRNCCAVNIDTSLQLYTDDSSLSLAKRAVTDRTPLFIASLQGRKKCVELLLKYGANPNACASYNVSPLYAAAEEGHLKIVEILLENNANVNTEADNKKIPLHAASEKGHTLVVKLLLEAGASIDATDNNGTTPLLAATKNKRKHVVKLLVKYDADPNKLDKIGNFALRESVTEFEILELLLNNNADTSLMNKNQECALLSASEIGEIDTVTLLLQRGADPNIKTLDQRSPLFAAVERKHNEIVRALLMYKANPNEKNQSHESIAYVASETGDANIVRMITNATHGILPRNIIQTTSHSIKTPELPIIDRIKKPKRKKECFTKRRLGKVMKNRQKKSDAILEYGKGKLTKSTACVKGTIYYPTSSNPTASKSNKMQKSIERISQPLHKRKNPNLHFRP